MKFNGKLSNGFKYTIETDVIDDYEFFELLSKCDTNVLLVKDVFSKLLGEKQKDNLVAYLKKSEGRAKMSRMQELVQEMFEVIGSNNQIKN